ncbi:MAG: hypothetical protein HFG41_06715 [Coprococcus sp.]|nr:hypothetical protein [Coprococcus sp.]
MEPGRASQTVYRRSILKQLHNDTHAALFPLGQEESCYGISCKEKEQILSCSVSLFGNEKDLCVFAIAQAANHLAAKGAVARGVSIQILLPDFAFESRVKAMYQAASAAASAHEIEILKADAQFIPGLHTTIVSVSALGCVEQGVILRQSRMAQPGEDIVLLKKIALEGALRVRRAKEEEAAARFAPFFLERLEAQKEQIFSMREIRAAASAGSVSALHQIVDGGILAALWDIAESAGIGLTVDLRKIAVGQETIEVCELFHLNPYQLTSAGSALVITKKGEELADTMIREGVPAVVIGHTQKGKERLVMNGDDKRCLNRPAPDAFVHLWAQENISNAAED